jgi:hypothetical protein
MGDVALRRYRERFDMVRDNHPYRLDMPRNHAASR